MTSTETQYVFVILGFCFSSTVGEVVNQRTFYDLSLLLLFVVVAVAAVAVVVVVVVVIC